MNKMEETVKEIVSEKKRMFLVKVFTEGKKVVRR